MPSKSHETIPLSRNVKSRRTVKVFEFEVKLVKIPRALMPDLHSWLVWYEFFREAQIFNHRARAVLKDILLGWLILRVGGRARGRGANC
jgi:hypothetical protein